VVSGTISLEKQGEQRITEKIVLAYSGGLDTSVLIKWLQERYDAEVITVTVDVGQKENLNEIEEKAKKLGVLKHYSIDAKDKFAKNYVFPAIKANALYEGKYPISTSLSRPLIVEEMVEVAKENNATGLAHGCTGKGNDQVRFDISFASLAPNLKIIAPVREWNMTREEELEYASKRGIQVSNAAKKYSIDQSIWGRSIECGILEDPNQEPPEDVFEWTISPEKAPNNPEYITIKFQTGIPTSVNDEDMEPLHLIKIINEIAGKHGVGRIDHIEDRLVGIKSREIYECPAAVVLLEAHKDLEKLILTRHEIMFKQAIDSKWTFLAYAGLWNDPLREDLEAFINKSQEKLKGEVRLKLFKGGLQVVGRSSEFSLYDKNLVNYNIKTGFNQSYSKGFIELWGLQTKMANILKQKKNKDMEKKEMQKR
jgi:argininosuccinate synthase